MNKSLVDVQKHGIYVYLLVVRRRCSSYSDTSKHLVFISIVISPVLDFLCHQFFITAHFKNVNEPILSGVVYKITHSYAIKWCRCIMQNVTRTIGTITATGDPAVDGDPEARIIREPALDPAHWFGCGEGGCGADVNAVAVVQIVKQSRLGEIPYGPGDNITHIDPQDEIETETGLETHRRVAFDLEQRAQIESEVR